MTRQKSVILEELQKLKTHPTASEVYERVRKEIPNISLGTVYRNLELLTQANHIQKIELTGKKSRFDGNLEKHFHFRCLVCERVYDIYPDKDSNLIDEEFMKAIRGKIDFDILDYKLEFRGYCKECNPSDKK